ncbi:MAG: S8 family serine peptidase [Acidimicrobiia bacterium]
MVLRSKKGEPSLPRRLLHTFAALMLVVGLVVLAGPAASGAADEGGPSGPSHATDHVLVELKPDADVQSVLGGDVEHFYGSWYRVPVETGSVLSAMSEISGRSGVAAVEPDYVVHVNPVTRPFGANGVSASLVVDDPFTSYQWHLPAVQTESAWDTSTGEGVLVAVIDSGISQGGEDFDCQTLVHPYNAITATPGAAAATDDNGHGTHVAGTVAQCTDNGIGVAGVAFDAQLMPVKVLDENGDGEFSDLVTGIEWARSHGADVINMSLGCLLCFSEAVSDAIDAAVADGIVVVASSGNDGAGTVGFPASHPDVIAVGAADFNDIVTSYSNRGAALDLVAPGGDTSQDANGDGEPDGVLQETFVGSTFGYYWYQGTSQAAPHVAGAAALLRCVAPGIDATTIKTALESTALDLGAPGFDTDYGHGLLQIDDAVDSLAGLDNTAPSWPGGSSLVGSEVTATSVTLSWPEANDDACIAGYRVYQDSAQVSTTSFAPTSTTVGGLEPLTEYAFEVRPEDVAGNLGPPLMTTVETLDGTAPVWGEDAAVRVTRFGETELELSWDMASDNIGVTGYSIDLGEGPVSTTDTETLVTGLSPGTAYPAEVRARDAVGNWSLPLSTTVRTARHFLDTPGTTFFDDILWMSGMDITRGCNPPVNNLFCPGDPVNRGQMAAFLNRYLGLPAASQDHFTDDAGTTFEDDINRLAEAGITKGCNPPDNDRYCPDDTVAREQMAAFITRALGLTANTHAGFVDVTADNIFRADIGKLATAGITKGCNPPDNTRFCPAEAVTRGQMAAFLHRADQLG